MKPSQRADAERNRRQEMVRLMEQLRGVVRNRYRSSTKKRRVLRTKRGTLQLAFEYIKELQAQVKKLKTESALVAPPPTPKTVSYSNGLFGTEVILNNIAQVEEPVKMEPVKIERVCNAVCVPHVLMVCVNFSWLNDVYVTTDF